MIKIYFLMLYGDCKEDLKIRLCGVLFLVTFIIYIFNMGADPRVISTLFILSPILLVISVCLNAVNILTYIKYVRFLRNNSYYYGVLLPSNIVIDGFNKHVVRLMHDFEFDKVISSEDALGWHRRMMKLCKK